MKHILFKSLMTTLFSIVASVLVVNAGVAAMGGVMDGITWLLTILCPLLVATPAGAYISWQSERLRRAHLALEAAHCELAAAHHELTERARHDAMTGLLNRETFIKTLETQLRHDRGVLLIIDADNFKSINDRYGHHAGDEALVAIATAIARGARAGDIIGRIGGEEFGAVLVDADREAAAQIAERVRLEVERTVFRVKGRNLPLTVSIGGAELRAGATASEHVRAADTRLYLAKNGGRNRCVFDLEAASSPGTRPLLLGFG